MPTVGRSIKGEQLTMPTVVLVSLRVILAFCLGATTGHFALFGIAKSVPGIGGGNLGWVAGLAIAALVSGVVAALPWVRDALSGRTSKSSNWFVAKVLSVSVVVAAIVGFFLVIWFFTLPDDGGTIVLLGNSFKVRHVVPFAFAAAVGIVAGIIGCRMVASSASDEDAQLEHKR